MTEKDIINEVKSTNWKAYEGPKYFKPHKLVDALLNLVQLRREDYKWDTYNEILFAIGNNHAGTYYPAILAALPLLIKLLKTSKREAVRNCIFEIFSEWYYSFTAEVGADSQFTKKQVENFVRKTIKELIIGQKWNESKRNELLITNFMLYFNEEART